MSSKLPDVVRIDTVVFSILSDILPRLVSLQWLPHIKCIFSVRCPCRIIAVIADHTPKDAVPTLQGHMSGFCFQNSANPSDQQSRGGTAYPIPLYMLIATLLLSLTKRSTNHASYSSPARSRLLVNSRARPKRRAEGATVRAVMWACHGR